MNKIKTTKIMAVILFAFIFCILELWLFHDIKENIKWLTIAGSLIFLIGRGGQYLAPNNMAISKKFSIVSKVGIITAATAFITEGLSINRQKEVYVIGTHVVGPEAATQGTFLIVFGIIIAIFAVKYID